MTDKLHRLHRIAGLILLLPLLGWVSTGLIFFIKPGYENAYEKLPLRFYPLERPIQLPGGQHWDEIRLLRTVLGSHLLVRSGAERFHLDPQSLLPRPLPTAKQLSALVNDAIDHKPRYGEIAAVEGTSLTTSTGIEISIDWDSLTLTQRGRDTRLIGLLYRVHYLQWTGHKTVDQLLGGTGLLLLAGLTILGLRLSCGGGRPGSHSQ